ncbi:MAG: Ig-like domain-containing protein [candidate division Zixibacteria bacterium]|nr:Ig-like domain-containing protein [candidate division Zixibacteria bacterium]
MSRLASLVLFFPLLTVFVQWLACAEVAPPPGGDADRTKPFLIGSSPQNGAVNVEPDNTVVLYFSEDILKPATAQAVYISPRPATAPKVKWKSDHVRIVFADDFSADQTYLVSVSSEITDLRKNRVDSSLVVAFSTGPTIDSGIVSGIVTKDSQPQGGLLAALFDARSLSDTTVYDSLYPDYVTQTTQDGRFVLQYLPDNEYYLIAFHDKNRDERFNPAREAFAVPDRRVVVGGDIALDDLRMTLTQQDTLVPDIISVTFTPSRLTRIRLTREIPTDWLRRDPARLRLVLTQDSSIAYPSVGFLESDKSDAAILNTYFGEVPPGAYRLECVLDTPLPPLVYERFEFAGGEDRERPEVTAFRPGPEPVFLEQAVIEATFSEPLDTSRMTNESFILVDASDRSLPLQYAWVDPFHVRFESANIQPGGRYRLAVTEFDIADLAGNTLGDSLRTYSFAVLDDDSLGSVGGMINIGLPGRQGDIVALQFSKVGTDQVFDMTAAAGDFTIRLPAGRYLLSGFIDTDVDGKRFAGSIYPFRLSETQATHPDTVAVRARFETTDIQFNFR